MKGKEKEKIFKIRKNFKWVREREKERGRGKKKSGGQRRKRKGNREKKV